MVEGGGAAPRAKGLSRRRKRGSQRVSGTLGWRPSGDRPFRTTAGFRRDHLGGSRLRRPRHPPATCKDRAEACVVVVEQAIGRIISGPCRTSGGAPRARSDGARGRKTSGAAATDRLAPPLLRSRVRCSRASGIHGSIPRPRTGFTAGAGADATREFGKPGIIHLRLTKQMQLKARPPQALR